MRFTISKEKLQQLSIRVENLLNSELDTLKKESEEFGLGEMSEWEEINSVDKIIVNRINPISKTKVFITIIANNPNSDDFQNLRAELQFRMNDYFPNLELYINDILIE